MILLDTHALVWYLDDPQNLSRRAEEAISAGFRKEGAAISDITLWEIAMLVQKGRLTFASDVEEWLTDLNTLPNFRKCRITGAVAALSTRLPDDFHGDPADRLIVATALDLGVPLATRDRRIRAYPHVETLW